jgi:malate dehydrogenase
MEKIAIIGSGNVGANAAFFIAETGVTDVVLYDIREGLATGKALDMMEGSPIRKYRNRIIAAVRMEEIADSQVVVIAAGAHRTAGMKREELFEANRGTVTDIGKKILEHAPSAIVVIATEPVDPLTAWFVKRLGFRREKVIGVGGILDSTRLRHALSRATSLSLENIAAMVIGPHGDDMLIVPQLCRISGIPVTRLLSAEEFLSAAAETRTAGDLIVRMAGQSSSYYAPSAAIAEIADAVHMDLQRVMSVSILLDGEYGLKDAAMSLPCVIGGNGVERILLPRLEPAVLAQLRESAGRIRDILNRAGNGKGTGK